MSEHESWTAVVGFEDGYMVSDQGEVWSIRKGRSMRLDPNKDGYLSLALWRDGKRTRRYVHTLVAEAFHGPRPDGLQIRHLDGNVLNNTAANLAYGTGTENQLDSVAHGTHRHSRRDACVNGHPFDDENTYRYKRRRICRACNREAAARRRSKEDA